MKRTSELKRTPFKPAEPKPPKGPKPKKCANRECRKPYMPDPRQPFVTFCSPDCGAVIALDRIAKQKAKQQRQERAQDKVKREAMKTRSDYLKEAQAAWNAYVRARDFGKPCCSCGATPEQSFGGTMDCSHYRSRGSAPHLAFHLHNAAAACVKCNRYLGGNVVALRAGLVERFGEERILAVEADQRPRNYSKDDLIRIKRIFSKKTRRLLRSRSG
jgi:hypothetical protein